MSADNCSQRATNRKKLVVVGDGACGKTCLLISFTTGEFPEKHIPTVFETFVADIKVQDQRLQFTLWDTAGQEDYELLRPLSYPNTDVLVLCFAIDNRDSFENVPQKWVPEISHYCPSVPVVLVGTKVDMREEAIERLAKPPSTSSKTKTPGPPVAYKEGAKMAKTIKAYTYMECSSKTKEGIEDVFVSAGKAILLGNRKRRPCTIL